MLSPYRGRLAPSPTGYLHLGHARTFWTAYQRARAARGKLVFRNEDLDFQRCKPEFVAAMYEDLRWLGLSWDEGPDVGGEFGPYSQSQRRDFYLEAWRKLRDGGFHLSLHTARVKILNALSPLRTKMVRQAHLHQANISSAKRRRRTSLPRHVSRQNHGSRGNGLRPRA